MKKRYAVRVVLPDGINEATEEVRCLLEQLRYAGLVTVHRDDDRGVCFDLNCPAAVGDSYEWARQNAARMQSFTYNAVAAPATE